MGNTELMQQYGFGYWQSIYPRSIISMTFEGPTHNKRLIMTPEIYLKDTEKLYEDLRIRDNAATQQWSSVDHKNETRWIINYSIQYF